MCLEGWKSLSAVADWKVLRFGGKRVEIGDWVIGDWWIEVRVLEGWKSLSAVADWKVLRFGGKRVEIGDWGLVNWKIKKLEDWKIWFVVERTSFSLSYRSEGDISINGYADWWIESLSWKVIRACPPWRIGKF